MNAPLILTAVLDEESQRFFDEKRKLYFPPELNFLAAHLTLFHHLPAGEPLITDTIESICITQKIVRMQVTKPVGIGRGVAYKIESNELVRMHSQMRKRWFSFLTPQDRQGLWPHVTVLNKVSPQIADGLLKRLQPNFIPFTSVVTGFALWYYLNGPWQLYRQFAFGG